MTTATMTITEALSEINLIDKKIDSKSPVIIQHLVRVDHSPDPYEKEGGSAQMIQSEFQAVTDLIRRHEKFKAAIAKANLDTQITIGNTTKSVHDWLVWKRDYMEHELKFVKQMLDTVKMNQDTFNRAPQVMKEQDGSQRIVKLLVNVDLPFFQRKLEELVTVKEKLDGQLSLKNATVTVTV